MTASGTYERSGDNGEILAMTVLKRTSNGSDLPEDATKNFECRLLPPTKVTLRHFLNGEEPREGETAQNYYDEKFVMREFVLPLLEVKDTEMFCQHKRHVHGLGRCGPARLSVDGAHSRTIN